MLIRDLDPTRDFAITRALFDRAADYLALEYGQPPDDATVTEFFTDCPPGQDPAQSLRLGLFDQGRLIGVADMAFGYPEAADAYIGLMLLDPAMRGAGIGVRLLDHLQGAARARGANRLLLAVLEANPRGHAYWRRMGFVDTAFRATRQFGNQSHTLVRMERGL